MSESTDIKYSLDEKGERYFPATHVDAVIGIDKITESLKPSGEWIEFTPLSGTPNTAFKAEGENGINCAYRTIELLGIKIKSIRINLSNIKNGMIIQNLPVNFTKESQSWLVRTPAWHLPVTISLRPSGKLALSMADSDKTNWIETDYIYGEYTWFEIEEGDNQ